MKSKIKKYGYISIIIIIGISVLYIFKDQIKDFISLYLNAQKIEEWVQSFGKLGGVIFIALQIIQVVIFFIPGEFMQAAGGYLFGTLFGTILSILGILFGSIITFKVAKRFGNRLLVKILPYNDYIKIKELICKPRNQLVIFTLYLLPGFPKDILGYVAGITSIKLKNFIILSTIARLPGIFISSYVGSNLYNRNYLVVVYTLVAVCVVLFLGIINKERVLRRFK